MLFFSLFFLLFLKYFFVLRGTSGSPYLDKAQQLQDRRCPFLPVCVVFSCVQTAAWLPVFGIFNAHTDDDGYNCTQGLYRYFCDSALIVDSEKNCLPQWGVEPAS